MDKSIKELFDECTLFPASIQYKGNTVVGADHFSVTNGDKLKLIFESVNSKWEQAVRLKIDRELTIDGDKSKGFTLWKRYAPDEIIVEITKSKSGILIVHNVWDIGDGTTLSWLGNSGMIVEEIDNGRRYRCNDGHLDDDFDDLVFRIVRL